MRSARTRPVVVLTGARQTGKTSTFRRLFPDHEFVSLDLPRRAIDLLEANRRYEFGIPPLAFNHYYGNMYPLYVRGLAYLALHQAEDAAAEFTRLLSHPGLAAGDPVDAAARRQLARAWALSPAVEKAKAKAAYNEFLVLWKSANPDIPMLKQAKTEYANLQSQQHTTIVQ